MSSPLGIVANVIISGAYFAIMYAILAPLVRTGELRSNRLGAATAAIFFSCAVGHGFHALFLLSMPSGGHGSGTMVMPWYLVAADLATAGIAVYYWSLRRTYGALMQGATLFEDLEQRRRLIELEHREAITRARAEADGERAAQAKMLEAVIANSQSLIYVKDLDGRYLLANEPFERAFGVDAADLLGKTDEFLDPALAPVWRANDLRAQQAEIRLDEWSNGADGRIDYESVKFPLRDAHGEV